MDVTISCIVHLRKTQSWQHRRSDTTL